MLERENSGGPRANSNDSSSRKQHHQHTPRGILKNSYDNNSSSQQAVKTAFEDCNKQSMVLKNRNGAFNGSSHNRRKSSDIPKTPILNQPLQQSRGQRDRSGYLQPEFNRGDYHDCDSQILQVEHDQQSETMM